MTLRSTSRALATALALTAGCSPGPERSPGDPAQGTATLGLIGTAVTWSVREGSAGGTVTPAGLYSAPATPGTYHVVATSVADPSKSAAAVVTVASGALWRPHPGTSWQWQLSAVPAAPYLAVQMYDIDLFDAPATTIAALHAQGTRVVCYLSAGTYENWRPDASAFPAAVLGNAVSGWAGERWLDTRAQAVRDVMTARMDLAVQKGCDAIEPDNVDGYANSPGFPLTSATQLDYNRFLAQAAHARNLSVGLKNDLDQVAQLVGDFDFAVVEECFQYGECDLAHPFVAANKAVFEVEYGDQALANQICPSANAANLDALVKNLELDAFRIACR